MFDLRWGGSAYGGFKVENVAFRNIDISDPFPTCPLISFRPREWPPQDNELVGGRMRNMSWENVTMSAHSTYNRMPPWYCAQQKFRWGLDASMGCSLPYGIPQQFHGGNGSDPAVNISQLSFTNVFVNGTTLRTAIDRPYGATFTGLVEPITFDGVPWTPPSVALRAARKKF